MHGYKNGVFNRCEEKKTLNAIMAKFLRKLHIMATEECDPLLSMDFKKYFIASGVFLSSGGRDTRIKPFVWMFKNLSTLSRGSKTQYI